MFSKNHTEATWPPLKSLFRSQRVPVWSGEPTEEIKNCTLTSCQHIRCRAPAEINTSLFFGHQTESVCSILPLQGSSGFLNHDRSLSQRSVTQFSIEMYSMSFGLLSFCEFAEMISDTRLNHDAWEQWAKTVVLAAMEMEVSETENDWKTGQLVVLLAHRPVAPSCAY